MAGASFTFPKEINKEHKETLNIILPNFGAGGEDCSSSNWYEGIIVETKTLVKGFSAIIRLNINTKEEALDWLRSFEEKSKTTFRVERTHPENTQKIIFKKEFHCVHNTKPKRSSNKPHEKNFNCNAKLTITVKNKGMKRSKDKYLKSYPCEILLRHNHNHPFYTSTVLKYRPPSQELQHDFTELFRKGHSPSTALSVFKDMLFEEHGVKYHEVVADGQKCPTQKWVYDLYYKMFKKEYGEPTGAAMIDSQKKCIDEYNKKCGEICAAINTEDNLVIAICSPTMKRVHQYIKASSEIMFVDASGNMDRHNTKVFLFLCPSVVGALPLGVLMTYSESENAITNGIQLLKTIMPQNSFYRQKFPSIIITDDCDAERNSLQTCFKNSTLLLCKFHVLQSVMRFLWDSKNCVAKHDRVDIYKFFRNALNCLDESKFLEAYKDLLNIQCVLSNKKVFSYLQTLGSRAKLWALCYRTELLTRNNETNNYAEATFRILKDKILLRKKAFSIVQLFDYITATFEHYYFKKIADMINGRWEGSKRKNKYYISKPQVTTTNLQCRELDCNLYEVISNDNTYIVNYELELCTCYIGSRGAPCKHQFAVVNKFKLVSQQFHPTLVDSYLKKLLHIVIHGTECQIEGWYENLNEYNENSGSAKTQATTVDVKIEGADIECTSCTPTSISNESNSKPVTNINAGTDDIRKQLEQCIDVLMEKYDNNMQEFDKPIQKFIHNFHLCKTDSSLVTALCTFGKYNGAGRPKINRGKNLQGGRNIGVQPTALARRKTVLGGRNAIHSGRPPKRLRLSDHAYSKTNNKENFEIPKPSRVAAPHSLSYCVQENITLGKTHAKK